MPHEEHKRMTAWTVVGISVVSITLILAGLGMVLAIRQTQSLAMLRIADLRYQAQSARDDIHNQVLPRLELFLEDVSHRLRAGRAAELFAGMRPPAWISEIYLFEADSVEAPVVIWRRQADDRWQRWTGVPGGLDETARIVVGHLVRPLLSGRFDPQRERLQFAYEVLHGDPLVIAHLIDAPEGGAQGVVGARLNCAQLQARIIEPAVPGDRIGVEFALPERARALRRASAWSEDLGPLAPFLWLVPQKSFVAGQHNIVRRQTVLLVAATVLATVALLAVMWAMWRVFNRQVALSRMKQAFVADVSHELKTPLALIRLFAETLLSGRVLSDQKQREYYDVIVRESTRLTHLIDSILDQARIDAAEKRYRMRRVDVAALVRKTYETYRMQLDHEGFEHQLVVADRLPEIKGDADALAQALINLINNAMKYTDEEERFLGIDVSRETRRGGHGVLISVSDRGIGIKPEDRNHVFSGFYRADDERVRRRRGAGLGLALVKHIVDAHGGIVDVESRLVKGSTFRIFLPAGSNRALLENEDDAPNPDR